MSGFKTAVLDNIRFADDPGPVPGVTRVVPPSKMLVLVSDGEDASIREQVDFALRTRGVDGWDLKYDIVDVVDTRDVSQKDMDAAGTVMADPDRLLMCVRVLTGAQELLAALPMSAAQIQMPNEIRCSDSRPEYMSLTMYREQLTRVLEYVKSVIERIADNLYMRGIVKVAATTRSYVSAYSP